MATSYPRRNTSGGIWKITDLAKNLLEEGTWPSRPVGARGVCSGGNADPNSNVIDYITIPTAGDATDFGDLSAVRSRVNHGAGNFTRGICKMGGDPATSQCDFITYSSTGNAADFGDLSGNKNSVAGIGNDVFGYAVGGSGVVNVIEVMTIAVTGNAVDFGDLTAAKNEVEPAASPT